MAQLGKTFALVTTFSGNGATNVKTAFEFGTLQRVMDEEIAQLMSSYPNGNLALSKDKVSATFDSGEETINFSIVTCEEQPVFQSDKDYSPISYMRHWSEEEQEKNFVVLDSNGNPVRFDDGNLVIYGDQECDGDVTKFDKRISVKELLHLMDEYPWLF